MTRATALVLALLAGLAVGCESEETPRYAPATRSRAAWLLEPPELQLGRVAEIELAVVTPPDHAPRPYRPPEAPAGLWVLGSETLDVRRDPSQWIHRTRLRLRPREVGRFEWPGMVVEVDTPSGGVETVEVLPLAIEVRSELEEHPGRTIPYGVREWTTSGGGDGSLVLGLVAGAALALAAVGLVALARRRGARGERARPRVASAEGPPAWESFRRTLAEIREQRDPVPALDAVSRALRRYVDERYETELAGRTTEELARMSAPFALTTRWEGFVALLSDLDAARFPRPSDDAALRDLASELVVRAQAFVDETTPREFR